MTYPTSNGTTLEKPNTFHNMFHLHKHVSPQQEAKFLRQTRRKAQPQHRHLEEGRLLKL